MTLLLHGTIHTVNSSFWLLSQLFYFRESKILVIQTQILPPFPMLKLPLQRKLMKIFLKLNILLLIFRTRLILSKQWRIIETNRAINSELSGTEIPKNYLHWCHAAYFRCANLQVNVKTMRTSSDESQSAVILLKLLLVSCVPKLDSESFPVLKTSFISNIKIFSVKSMKFYLWKKILSVETLFNHKQSFNSASFRSQLMRTP